MSARDKGRVVDGMEEEGETSPWRVSREMPVGVGRGSGEYLKDNTGTTDGRHRSGARSRGNQCRPKVLWRGTVMNRRAGGSDPNRGWRRGGGVWEPSEGRG